MTSTGPVLLGAAALGVVAPSATSFGPLRSALTPGVVRPALSGISTSRHVALTFDDGPDTASTSAFLDLLDRLGVRATFFVLGRHLGDRGLLRDMAGAGHEIGVHGWDHRPVALRRPGGLRDDILRTRDLVEDTTGTRVEWYRPPYGLMTPASRWAARSAGLRTVLWSARGRDWERTATATSVAAKVSEQLRPGGTVLLHDSDRTSTPGSWRATLGATAALVPRWLGAGLAVGPLANHWPGTPAAPEIPETRAVPLLGCFTGAAWSGPCGG
jgi:peptidoglycan/xylan/chitin deacetylase (PgdA/CDA1 family)